MFQPKPLRSFFLAAAVFAMLGCERAGGPAVDASRCAAPDYVTALVETIDEVQVFAGNQDGLAPSPLVINRNPEDIQAIASFFLERADLWYVAAGETYDPATRRSGAEFTIRFLSAGVEQTYVGWGMTYLETPGCGFEVVRPLSPPDRPELLHLLFGAPRRR